MIRQNTTRIYVSDYDSQMMPTDEITTYGTGNSQVSEPEIINPLNTNHYTPPVKPNLILQEIESNVPNGTPIKTPKTNNVTTNTDTANTDKEPSATTDETKTYVDGGTTPNSNIVVDKPKRNYVMYGLIGLVGVLVVYKVFFNKKTTK
jgi:hypothetical protein